MKMKIILSVLVIGFSFTIYPTTAKAQLGNYYKVNDYCTFHTNNACQAVVTKCRDRGGDFCAAFEQVPCEEACQWTLSL